MRTRKSPLSAVVDGAIAGLVGSYAIGKFFELTSQWAPKDDGGFVPPEIEQTKEHPVETVARRVYEDLAQGDRLPDEKKKAAGQAVHYAFGAAWGALFGAGAGTFPSVTSPIGAALFGAKVYAISDYLILPGFGLTASPGRYSWGHHAYSLAAHVAYGATVAAVFRALSSPIAKPLLLSAAAIVAITRMDPAEELDVIEEIVIIEEPIENFARL